VRGLEVRRYGRDLLVYVQNVRFSFKGNYYPPILWIEKYRPRARDYEIVISLDATKELAEALRKIADEIEASL